MLGPSRSTSSTNKKPHSTGVGLSLIGVPSKLACRGDYYAGDHLISHTLTRAVPSAQRGLTSVFGMGTGVTLAVNSPANWRRFAGNFSRDYNFLPAYAALRT